MQVWCPLENIYLILGVCRTQVMVASIVGKRGQFLLILTRLLDLSNDKAAGQPLGAATSRPEGARRKDVPDEIPKEKGPLFRQRHQLIPSPTLC